MFVDKLTGLGTTANQRQIQGEGQEVLTPELFRRTLPPLGDLPPLVEINLAPPPLENIIGSPLKDQKSWFNS